jgi:energy-coupling factor transporter ATPase
MEEKQFIRVTGLVFSYEGGLPPALKGIDLSVSGGEYVALMGANGSGKSTLLRLLNGLMLPQEGRVLVDGMDTADASSRGDIRRRIGMVFQNPDAQLVATTVEEDAAFGPENLGVDPVEMRERVETALSLVGLGGLGGRPPHLLSVGQKQLLALASVLTMKPDCFLLDEATAFLDPASRSRALDILDEINAGGATVVTATHDAREARRARRVVALSSGRVAADEGPESLFLRGDFLEGIGLEEPPPRRLARAIARRVPEFDDRLVDEDELLRRIGESMIADGPTPGRVRA